MEERLENTPNCGVTNPNQAERIISFPEDNIALLDRYIKEEGGHGAFMKKLRAIICKAGTPSDDVDDVLQEVYMKILSNVHGFQGKSRFMTWVYRLVRNHAYNYNRREERKGGTFERGQRSRDGFSSSQYTTVSFDDNSAPDVSAIPAQHSDFFEMLFAGDIQETQRRVLEVITAIRRALLCVNNLSDFRKEIYLLHQELLYEREKSIYEKLANHFRISDGTARSRVSRAHNFLEKQFHEGEVFSYQKVGQRGGWRFVYSGTEGVWFQYYELIEFLKELEELEQLLKKMNT